MKYLINNEIIYESEGRVLSNKMSPENSVLISETAGRLLTRLLDEPRIPLARNDIIHDVWDKYGFSGSGNSLNQYISLLRRNLMMLGCNDVIQTIPKMGFVLNATITVFPEEDGAPQKRAYPNPEPVVIDETLACGSKKNGPSRFMLLAVCTFLLVSIGLFILLRIYLVNHLQAKAIDNVQLHRLGSIDGCPVYTTSPFSSEFRQATLDKAQQLAKGSLPCIGGAFMIFDAEDNFIFNSEGSAFLTACTFENNNPKKLSGCRDIYVSN
ncbi:hypothetical protein TUM12370_07630 [Salmonella enterica subsp. enterica serovar Choleraesuis]|nr:hypothetical protein TUM12370_07630 [Salmonella enterica subsp. enterica serovar Choleraesuis]